MKLAWLKFFRIVNIPTVPGDVLAGASIAWSCLGPTACNTLARPFYAAAASIAIYLFGMADNDIVGAPTDGPTRPIPAGALTLTAAKIARTLCLASVLIIGALANLSPEWWLTMALLTAAILTYNRTKLSLLMGLCRGLNFLSGITTIIPFLSGGLPPLPDLTLMLALFLLWTLFITFVTKYSEGEHLDPRRKQIVGILIGALIYLQLIVLVLFPVRPFLITGAALLLALRLMKKLLPEVSPT